jgi:hypothetical protein
VNVLPPEAVNPSIELAFTLAEAAIRLGNVIEGAVVAAFAAAFQRSHARAARCGPQCVWFTTRFVW